MVYDLNSEAAYARLGLLRQREREWEGAGGWGRETGFNYIKHVLFPASGAI